MALTLSELAFLLLGVSLAAAVILAAALQTSHAREIAARAEAADLRMQVGALEEEVEELNRSLERLLGGVVACWRRPGSTIPPIVAVLTIEGSFALRLDADDSSPKPASSMDIPTTPETMVQDLESALRRFLAEELETASQDSCYLRIAVRNRTGSYELFVVVEEVVRGLGMVVVPE